MGTPGACFLNFRAYPSSRGNWPWLSENVSFFEHRKRPQFLRHWYRNMKLATLRSPRLAILLPHLLFTCASARAPRYANLFEARQRPERSCRASASNSRTHAETAPLPQAALPHVSQLRGRAPLWPRPPLTPPPLQKHPYLSKTVGVVRTRRPSPSLSSSLPALRKPTRLLRLPLASSSPTAPGKS